MSASNLAGSGAPLARGWDDEPRRWVALAFAVMLALIGLSIAFSIVIPVLHGSTFMWNMNGMEWGWVPGLIFGLIILWIIFWVVSGLLWRVSSPYWERHRYYRHYPHYYRHAYEYGDPAVAVARERLARGEITKDQYEQLLRDLGAPPGGAWPP